MLLALTTQHQRSPVTMVALADSADGAAAATAAAVATASHNKYAIRVMRLVGMRNFAVLGEGHGLTLCFAVAVLWMLPLLRSYISGGV